MKNDIVVKVEKIVLLNRFQNFLGRVLQKKRLSLSYLTLEILGNLVVVAAVVTEGMEQNMHVVRVPSNNLQPACSIDRRSATNVLAAVLALRALRIELERLEAVSHLLNGSFQVTRLATQITPERHKLRSKAVAVENVVLTDEKHHRHDPKSIVEKLFVLLLDAVANFENLDFGKKIRDYPAQRHPVRAVVLPEQLAPVQQAAHVARRVHAAVIEKRIRKPLRSGTSRVAVIG